MEFTPAIRREPSQASDSGAPAAAEASGRKSLNGTAGSASGKRRSGNGAAGRLVLYEPQPNPVLSASIDPAVTPSAAAGTVSFLGRAKAGAGAPLAREPSRHRYFANETDLSVDKNLVKPAAEDSDEDELEAMWVGAAWHGLGTTQPARTTCPCSALAA